MACIQVKHTIGEEEEQWGEVEHEHFEWAE